MFTVKNVNNALDKICENYEYKNIDMDNYIRHTLFLERLHRFLSKLISKIYSSTELLSYGVSYKYLLSNILDDVFELLLLEKVQEGQSETSVSFASIKIMEKKCKALKVMLDILLKQQKQLKDYENGNT